MNRLRELLIETCGHLNTNEVEYMIIGGTAVAFHGFSRRSMGMDGLPTDKFDIDIWFNPTISNYYNLLRAVKDSGKNTDELFKEVIDPKKSFLKFDYGEYNVDYNPLIPGFKSFYSTFTRIKLVKINEVSIPIIGYEDLIHSKEVLKRPNKVDFDNTDIDELRKRRDSSENK